MGRGRPRCGGAYRPIVSHTPNTMNGDVELVVNIAIGVRIPIIVTIVRGVAVSLSKADRRTTRQADWQGEFPIFWIVPTTANP